MRPFEKYPRIKSGSLKFLSSFSVVSEREYNEPSVKSARNELTGNNQIFSNIAFAQTSPVTTFHCLYFSLFCVSMLISLGVRISNKKYYDNARVKTKSLKSITPLVIDSNLAPVPKASRIVA